ncbi:MAG TPA: MFS transporter [Streptosporangiaceae bacterium]|nr:MFS transporter [Streptosporangiaceae bacterium]
MCAVCGIPTHVLELDELAPAAVPAPQVARAASAGDAAGLPAAAASRPARFAALRNADCRPYLIGAALAMMADNIEHVITYWVLWERFHSPALTGFEVISHWMPFLLFSVYFGALADRHDCRRLIQAAQVLFMLVSALWGVLFLTNSLHIWEACVLLILHGCAGSLWGPGEQLMLHDFVGREELPSAVRLNATFRSLGILFGPVVGSALLLGLGPTHGIFVNIAFYLPLTLFLFRTKFTGHVRDGVVTRQRIGVLDAVRVFREVRSNHTLVSMIVLAGLGSFFIGASLQTSMPIFAHSLGAGSAGVAYGVLLFANGVGGVIGGVLLEASSKIRPTVTAAVVSTAVYGVTSLFFALTSSYPLAVTMLLIGGVANLASMSITQTVVQLLAPPKERGRVVGLYGVSANGLRAGSGFTVGLLGAAIGVHWSLGISAAAMCAGTAVAALSVLRDRWRASPGPAEDSRTA